MAENQYSELQKLLDMLKSGGFASPSMLPLTLANLGGSVVSGVGNYLAGGERRKKLDEVYDTSKGLFASANSMLTPGALGKKTMMAERAVTPLIQARTNTASKRLGLDSGAAWKDIIGETGSIRADIFNKILAQAEQLSMQQKLAALQSMMAAASAR